MRTTPAATIGAALLLSTCGGGGSALPPAEDGVLRVVALDKQDFDADMYEAAAGEVSIEYVLDGFQSHTLTIEGLEDQLHLEVGKASAATATIILEPGRYMLYCDIAGHRASGMEARLLVS